MWSIIPEKHKKINQIRIFKRTNLATVKRDDKLVKSNKDNHMIIVNIPHSSVKLDFQDLFICDIEEATSEAYKLADLYTDEMVFDNPRFIKLVAPISRLVVDTERFVDDQDEPASQYGMGVIYTHSCSGKIIKHSPDAKLRQELLDKFYYPHHNLLESITHKSLAYNNYAIIIDLHSYPSSYRIGLQTDKQPDICIGYELPHYNKIIFDKIADFCVRNGWSYGVNEPFAGSIVPGRYYKNNPNVISFMIEIKRSLYMDEYTYQKKPEFEHLCREINRLLVDIDQIENQ